MNIAKILLEKKAVILSPKKPFTFVSGIKSPIYCDNRKMIAFPKEREEITNEFINQIKDDDFEVIAGTATAGIPWASFIADKLKKPLSYIRAEKKEHGASKQIEGENVKNKKVLIIEDLISTGGSSFSAVEACRENGGDVVKVVAIFTYEFEKANKKFIDGNCELVTLSNFSTLAKTAEEINYLSDDELKVVLEWNKDPQGWGKKNGFE